MRVDGLVNNKYEYIFLGYVIMLSINSQILNLKLNFYMEKQERNFFKWYIEPSEIGGGVNRKRTFILGGYLDRLYI